MQTITPEFVFTQIRIALIAGVAYAGGAGYFSTAGSTLALALITSLLPLLVPWAFSIYVGWNTTKVPLDSVAARVNVVEQKIAERVADPEKPSPTPQQVTAALVQTVTDTVKEKTP